MTQDDVVPNEAMGLPSQPTVEAGEQMDELRVDSVVSGTHGVLVVRGEIDAYTAPRLRTALSTFAEDGIDRIVVDLRNVTFIDSVGLGILAGAKLRVSSQGNGLCLVLDDSQASIRRLFEITGLTAILPIHGSLDEAVEDCLREPAA